MGTQPGHAPVLSLPLRGSHRRERNRSRCGRGGAAVREGSVGVVLEVEDGHRVRVHGADRANPWPRRPNRGPLRISGTNVRAARRSEAALRVGLPTRPAPRPSGRAAARGVRGTRRRSFSFCRRQVSTARALGRPASAQGTAEAAKSVICLAPRAVCAGRFLRRALAHCALRTAHCGGFCGALFVSS